MKILNYFKFALCAAVTAFAFSCTDETKEPVVFPEATTHTIAVGQEIELTFEAGASWLLNIDKPWLVFVDQDQHFPQLMGAAGTQTIKLTTENVSSIFEEETAVVSIKMDGKVETLFTITRTAVARSAKMFYGEYGETPIELTEATPLVVEYHDMGDILVAINFQANFPWKVASYPEWVDMEMFSGEANVEVTKQNYKFFYVKESAYASAQTGNFTITDMDGNNSFSFPVSYSGLPEDKVIVRTAENTMPGLWSNQIQISADQSEQSVIELSVMAKDNEYQVYYADWSMNQWTGSDQYAAADWLTIDTTTPGKLKISASSNTDKERTAFVWVLPKSEFPEGEVDIDWYYSNYNESYMFAVEQESGLAAAAGGFFAMWTLSLETAACVPFADYTEFAGMTPGDLSYGLPNDNTFVLELPAEINSPLGIHPIGFPEEWTPITMIEGYSMNFYRAMSDTFYTEPSNFESGYVYDMSAGFQSYNALMYNINALQQAKPGFMILSFYKDMNELDFYKPSAALIIVKK